MMAIDRIQVSINFLSRKKVAYVNVRLMCCMFTTLNTVRRQTIRLHLLLLFYVYISGEQLTFQGTRRQHRGLKVMKTVACILMRPRLHNYGKHLNDAVNTSVGPLNLRKKDQTNKNKHLMKILGKFRGSPGGWAVHKVTQCMVKSQKNCRNLGTRLHAAIVLAALIWDTFSKARVWKKDYR